MLRALRLAPLLASSLLLPAAALADDPQLYKWTDPQGTVHYSDQPPAQPASDLVVSGIPSFPPVDPVKLAQQQAALLAEVAALQQLNQARLAEQAQAAALAREQAELAAAQAQQAAAQPLPEPSQPIYVTSAFVPRVYRANLYLHVPHRGSAPHERATPVLRAPPLPLRP